MHLGNTNKGCSVLPHYGLTWANRRGRIVCLCMCLYNIYSKWDTVTSFNEGGEHWLPCVVLTGDMTDYELGISMCGKNCGFTILIHTEKSTEYLCLNTTSQLSPIMHLCLLFKIHIRWCDAVMVIDILNKIKPLFVNMDANKKYIKSLPAEQVLLT